MKDTTVPTHEIVCTKARGGKRALWHARHPSVPLVGAGNTADNAIRDLRKQDRIREATRAKVGQMGL